MSAAEDLGQWVRHLLDPPHDGRAKLYLLWRCLELRRPKPAPFEQGDYVPLRVSGQRAQHLCAFSRRHQDTGLIAIAPRLLADIDVGDHAPLRQEAWGDTRIEVPVGVWENILTGDSRGSQGGVTAHFLSVAEVLSLFSAAVLIPMGNYTVRRDKAVA